jgi:hypothetical protein
VTIGEIGVTPSPNLLVVMVQAQIVRWDDGSTKQFRSTLCVVQIAQKHSFRSAACGQMALLHSFRSAA